jgi:uncharacterized protein
MAGVENPRKEIITFLIITFLLSAIFYAFILNAQTMHAMGGLLTLGLMWCPGAAAIITRLAYHRSLRGMGWKFGKAKWLLLAYLLPVAYAVVPYVLTWLSGLGRFSTANLPADQPLPVFLAVNLTFLFLLGSVPSALGEEIGWRGMLVPQLSKLYSLPKVALISGLIWALWHAPVVVFADYGSGTPVLYALACFIVMVVGASFAFTWLRIKSGSLWTAVVLHASHNLIIQAILDPLTQDTGITPYIVTEFGIGLALAAGIMGVVFWRMMKGKAAGLEEMQAQAQAA